MHVANGGDKVLPYPWVVRILDTMFGTHLPHSGGDVRVPGRRHPGEEMVLNLEVETTSNGSREPTAVRGGGLDLRLEPAHGFPGLAVVLGRIAIRAIEVV